MIPQATKSDRNGQEREDDTFHDTFLFCYLRRFHIPAQSGRQVIVGSILCRDKFDTKGILFYIDREEFALVGTVKESMHDSSDESIDAPHFSPALANSGANKARSGCFALEKCVLTVASGMPSSCPISRKLSCLA